MKYAILIVGRVNCVIYISFHLQNICVTIFHVKIFLYFNFQRKYFYDSKRVYVHMTYDTTCKCDMHYLEHGKSIYKKKFCF